MREAVAGAAQGVDRCGRIQFADDADFYGFIAANAQRIAEVEARVVIAMPAWRRATYLEGVREKRRGNGYARLMALVEKGLQGVDA